MSVTAQKETLGFQAEVKQLLLGIVGTFPGHGQGMAAGWRVGMGESFSPASYPIGLLLSSGKKGPHARRSIRW